MCMIVTGFWEMLRSCLILLSANKAGICWVKQEQTVVHQNHRQRGISPLKLIVLDLKGSELEGRSKEVVYVEMCKGFRGLVNKRRRGCSMLVGLPLISQWPLRLADLLPSKACGACE